SICSSSARARAAMDSVSALRPQAPRWVEFLLRRFSRASQAPWPAPTYPETAPAPAHRSRSSRPMLPARKNQARSGFRDRDSLARKRASSWGNRNHARAHANDRLFSDRLRAARPMRFFLKLLLCLMLALASGFALLALRSGDAFYSFYEWVSPARFQQYDPLI